MLKAKVLRCITNAAPVAGFDNDRRLPDGQRDLGPTFNAMRKNQKERRDQEARHWCQIANVANQLGGNQLYGMLAAMGGCASQGNSSALGAQNCNEGYKQSYWPEKFW